MGIDLHAGAESLRISIWAERPEVHGFQHALRGFQTASSKVQAILCARSGSLGNDISGSFIEWRPGLRARAVVGEPVSANPQGRNFYAWCGGFAVESL